MCPPPHMFTGIALGSFALSGMIGAGVGVGWFLSKQYVLCPGITCKKND
jgi:hypothetical protein